ncbi:hypothetical protein ZWY2020_037668 [Hordeum vulgare]|nr:hypothetical protein ZWY2020_037668 [Hordeum vulgare]
MSSPRRFSWVVLRKYVPVFHAEEKEQEDKIMAEASKDWGNIEKGSWILDQFSLDLHLVEPPELSTLSVRAKIETRERGIICVLDSVVENYLVMTLVFWDSRYGLVYDAAKNSLSLLPAIMYSFSGCDFASVVDPVPFYLLRPLPSGHATTAPSICSLWGSGSRVTTECWRGRPCSSGGRAMPLATSGPSRRRASARIPSEDVELDFIHLPQECQGRDFSRSYPRDRRTMGPVGGSIKLISIVTISGDTPHDNTAPADIVLRSWTLSPDLHSWTRDQDMELPLPLLWQSEAYKRERLPQAMPQRPVLKADEEGVLYLLLGDYYLDWERRARLCREIECVISIDMRTKSLLSCSHRPIKDGLPARALWEDDELSEGFYPDIPSLFAAKFCANHTGWSDGLLHKDKRNRLI